jgi:predicted HNH restriction endonuclease
VGDIQEALSSLGGRAHLSDITEMVLQIAEGDIPPSAENVIRGRLQDFSSDSTTYKASRPDLFHCVHGVRARKGVWALRKDDLSPQSPDNILDAGEPQALEGRLRLRQHFRRERSRALIDAFKESLNDFSCRVCGFDFEATYGDLGHAFIEAHHTVPVATLEPGVPTKLSDLVAVCSNCHRMLHRNGLLDWQELRARV